MAAPEVRVTDPPELALLKPAVIVTSEPAPVSVLPTVNAIVPALPPKAAPDESDNAPLGPVVDAPELNLTEPVVVPPAVCSTISPVVGAVPPDVN